MEKVDALKLVIADPNRSASDKETARTALGRLHSNSHDQAEQDRCLELWFAPRGEKYTSRDIIEARRQFDAQTQQLLDDLTHCPYLGLPPADNAEERLKALFARTQSEIVRQRVTDALESIAWCRDKKAVAA